MVRARLIRAAIVIALAGAAATLVWAPLPPLCPFRVVLRLPCPTCGMTRAARLILSQHFVEAARVHPLAVPVLPLLFLIAVAECVVFVHTGAVGTIVRRRAPRIAAQVALAALVAVWAARFLGAFGGPTPV